VPKCGRPKETNLDQFVRFAMLAYPARLIPADDGFVLVRFPDVPEAAATGGSEDEALENARPVLETVLRGYRRDERLLPRPSDICGAPSVEVGGFEASELAQEREGSR
jgi:predicted RNase H-like HicB family nuclease